MNHNFSSTCNVSLQNSKAKSAVAPYLYPVPYFFRSYQIWLTYYLYNPTSAMEKKAGREGPVFHHVGNTSRVFLLGSCFWSKRVRVTMDLFQCIMLCRRTTSNNRISNDTILVGVQFRKVTRLPNGWVKGKCVLIPDPRGKWEYSGGGPRAFSKFP